MNYITGTIHKEKYEYYYRYIGLLLTYEMFRKYLEINKIYIKLINEVKEINLPNTKKKQIILTDISNTYDMIVDIKIILPTVEIINVNYRNMETIEYSIKNLKIQYQKTQIFILEKQIVDKTLINLITCLKNEKHMAIEDITIGCIQINHTNLNKIGSQYPELNIYTTQIIN